MRISLRHKKSMMKMKQGLKQCGVDDDQSDTNQPLQQVIGKRSLGQELEEAENEIRALGMESYCSVLRF